MWYFLVMVRGTAECGTYLKLLRRPGGGLESSDDVARAGVAAAVVTVLTVLHGHHELRRRSSSFLTRRHQVTVREISCRTRAPSFRVHGAGRLRNGVGIDGVSVNSMASSFNSKGVSTT